MRKETWHILRHSSPSNARQQAPKRFRKHRCHRIIADNPFHQNRVSRSCPTEDFFPKDFTRIFQSITVVCPSCRGSRQSERRPETIGTLLSDRPPAILPTFFQR